MVRKFLLTAVCTVALAGFAPGFIQEATAATRSMLYVANSQGDDISIIDLATQKVVKTLKVGPIVHGVCAQADGRRAFATIESNNQDNTEAEILAGVTAIVNQMRTRLPDTKLLICAIFPRGKTFSTQRGKILQVNQALAKLDDGKMISYIDFGSQMIEPDGSISTQMMRDALHPGEAGYQIWADAIEPKMKEWVGK